MKIIRKILAPIKIKSALPPPPPQTQNTPSPKTRNFMDMAFFLQKERIFPGVHKIGAAISGPRITDKHFYGHEDFSEISLLWQIDSRESPRFALRIAGPSKTSRPNTGVFNPLQKVQTMSWAVSGHCRKGLADRGGWREEILLCQRQASFCTPFSYVAAASLAPDPQITKHDWQYHPHNKKYRTEKNVFCIYLSGPIRPRQGTEICSFGAPSPLEALLWIFCSFSRFYLQFSKKRPRKSGESSKKSSGENRVKSCHVCGCHVFSALNLNSCNALHDRKNIPRVLFFI